MGVPSSELDAGTHAIPIDFPSRRENRDDVTRPTGIPPAPMIWAPSFGT